MHFQHFKSRVLPALLLIFLASCSTKQAPVPTTKTQVTTGIEAIDVGAGALSAEQHVELAKTLDSNNAVNELLIATKVFYQQENYAKALWLADKTMPLVDENIINSKHEKVLLALIKASSLQKLEYYPESHVELNQLEQYASENNILLTASYYRLLSAAFREEEQPISALNAQLFEFSRTPDNAQNQQQISDIWHNFQTLSQWQLNLIALDKAPNSKGWLTLTALANKFGGDQAKMKYHLSIWQNKFKLHPANVIAKQLSSQAITPKDIKNIAVILPLSGKQQSAGRAIQQGILASFANDNTKSLHFVDSNTVNWYGLTNDFATLKVDFVIGPLLKSNVDKYISHTSAQTQA